MAPRRTKRPDGRYDVTARFEMPDGTRRRVFFYGRTQAEARAKANLALERAAVGASIRDASRSLADWLAEWRETFLLASDRAVPTKSLYAGLIKRHVEPVIGQLGLGLVRPSDITRVLLRMEQSGRSASTRRNTYAAVRAALDDAVADGLLAVNPVLRVERPRAGGAESTSLSPVEVRSLLEGADGLRYADVLRLILGTGLRRGEVLAVRWPDVCLDRGELTVRGSLVRREGRWVCCTSR